MADDFYTITTPAASDPIDFDAASKWCRDIDVADTVLVEQLIKSATDRLESMSNRVFVEKGYTGQFSNLCLSDLEDYPFVTISRSPLLLISEIRFNGVVLDVSEYALKQSSGFSRVWFFDTPTLEVKLPYPIEIDFTAGYGAVADVPDSIITMIEQTILFWYENRGDVSTDVKQQLPFVAKQILKTFRIVNVF